MAIVGCTACENGFKSGVRSPWFLGAVLCAEKFLSSTGNEKFFVVAYLIFKICDLFICYNSIYVCT